MTVAAKSNENLSQTIISPNLERMSEGEMKAYKAWIARLILNQEIPRDAIERIIGRQTEREIVLQRDLNEITRQHVDRDAQQHHLEDKIAELQAQLDTAEKEAHTDKLTGLPNRAGFEKRFAEMIRIVQESNDDISFCLAFLDLTGFKTVNDTGGHKVGDGMLAEVGQGLSREFLEVSDDEIEVSTGEYARLAKKASFRETDLIAKTRGPSRLGGDEFTILAPCSETFGEQELRTKIDKVFEVTSHEHEGTTYRVGTNVGIVLINKEQLAKYTPGRLLAQADARMYFDKHGVKPGFFDELFEPDVESVPYHISTMDSESPRTLTR
ncbi:MAG: GGDEF domain-containing protein [Alphaproteobacteria bacterium]